MGFGEVVRTDVAVWRDRAVRAGVAVEGVLAEAGLLAGVGDLAGAADFAGAADVAGAAVGAGVAVGRPTSGAMAATVGEAFASIALSWTRRSRLELEVVRSRGGGSMAFPAAPRASTAAKAERTLCRSSHAIHVGRLVGNAPGFVAIRFFPSGHGCRLIRSCALRPLPHRRRSHQVSAGDRHARVR